MPRGLPLSSTHTLVEIKNDKAEALYFSVLERFKIFIHGEVVFLACTWITVDQLWANVFWLVSIFQKICSVLTFQAIFLFYVSTTFSPILCLLPLTAVHYSCRTFLPVRLFHPFLRLFLGNLLPIILNLLIASQSSLLRSEDFQLHISAQWCADMDPRKGEIL